MSLIIKLILLILFIAFSCVSILIIAAVLPEYRHILVGVSLVYMMSIIVSFPKVVDFIITHHRGD